MLIGLTFVLLLQLIYGSIIQAQFHLRSIPGPWWAAYTRLWLVKALASEKCAEHYLEVNKKFGRLAAAFVIEI